MLGTRRWGVAVAMAMAAVAVPPAAAAATVGQADRRPGGLRITVTELNDQNGHPLVAAERINDRGQVLGITEAETVRRWVVLHRGRATPIGPEGFAPRIADFSERGQVVGAVDDETFSSRAFSAVDGRVEWLESPDEYRTSYATAVDDRGQVLGFRTGRSQTEIVVWRRDGVASLSPPPAPIAWPVDINNRGQALVGSTLWQVGDAAIELGSLRGADGLAHGADLNDRGQVAGQSQTADGAAHAFLWSDGRMIDLGTLGGRYSSTLTSPTDDARVLNERGHVVGYSDTADGRSAAFLWRDGHMIELASPGHRNSWPAAINDRDQVVGNSSYPTDGSTGAMSWLWQDGRLIDLGALIGDGEATVRDINDRGQIVGTYEGHAVMWTVRRSS